MHKQQVEALNQIIALVDQKATEYKDQYLKLSQAQRLTQKKFLLDMIYDASDLANQIRPLPQGIIQDLKGLEAQLSRMN